MKKVNILGTEYTIKEATIEEDYKLEEANGYCDVTTKEIVVEKIKEDKFTVKDTKAFTDKVLRHEIIHAFLYESGLHTSTENQWSINEEMIDWIAIQLPKIIDVLINLNKEWDYEN